MRTTEGIFGSRIHEVFEEQVKKTPDSIAIITEDQTLTYNQLNEKANQLANYLIKNNVCTNGLIGICVERSIDMIVGILGILKSGNAYVPFDSSYPGDRLSFMIKDTQVTIMLTSSKIADYLPFAAYKTILLDADWEIISRESTDNLYVDGCSDNIAYIIYTSGSTGTPKGVMVPHRGVIRLVKETNYHQFSIEEIFLQFASISFDAATFEIWGSLLNGCKLVIYPPVLNSLEELGRFIKKQNITTFWLTAGLFHQMVDNHIEYLSDIQYLFAGGDVLSSYHVKKILETYPSITMINGYGPTENTVFTTCHIMKEITEVGVNVSIGKSITNTDIYVLDECYNHVQIGEVGELFVGGSGLAMGYLNHPDLTAEKFIQDPFSDNPEIKLYRTGDLVRIKVDGNLEFVGRMDNQVKINGYRIELDEIESVIRQHNGIQDVIVMSQNLERGDKRIVAYYIALELEESELHKYLSKKVPVFMMPSMIIKMDSFPLSKNGKVDKKKLPVNPFAIRNDLVLQPVSYVEKVLVEIWLEVLGFDNVGIDKSFFELGGHSLLATKVLTRIRQHFGIEISMDVFFSNPKISMLTKYIETYLIENGIFEIGKNNIKKQNRDIDEFPLSFAQEQLWIINSVPNIKNTYNINYAYRLRGEINSDLLEYCINLLVQKYEILRTVFVVTEKGTPIQKILPEIEVKINYIESMGRTSDVDFLIKEILSIEFDLSKGPLIQPSLIKVGDDNYIFIMVLHHIISDGWSMGVISREISDFYNKCKNGEYKNESALLFQYVDYACWQKQTEINKIRQKQLKYWEGQLRNAPTHLNLPTDRSRSAIQSYRGAIHLFTIKGKLHEKLKEIIKEEKITMYMVLLAAFESLLFRYTGQEDILLGTHIAGRTHSELESLIGYFVNTVVIRADFSEPLTFRELISQVRRVTLEAYENQDVRFEEVVKKIQPNRSLSHNPMFQVAFILQNEEMNLWNLHDIKVDSIELDNGTAKFDVSLIMEESATGLVGKWEYNTDLFDDNAMLRMSNQFELLLEGMVTNMDQNVATAKMLTDLEKKVVIAANEDVNPISHNYLLHQLFEQQCLKTPQLIALSYGEDCLSYKMLDEEANKLANYLVDLGVNRNSIVGIYMERSIFMVISILGVLKAGGAYLPLDPSYPTDRLAYQLKDSNASVLLTEDKLYGSLFPVQNEICLDIEWASTISTYSGISPIIDSRTDDVAYVIYTSGSTGMPKGVLLPHRAICNHMLWMVDEFKYNSSDKLLQRTPFSFDASVWEFFAPLLSGGELVLSCVGKHTDPEYLIQTINEKRITTLQMVPSYLEVLVDVPEFSSCLSLQRVFCGGEKLSLELQRQFFNTLPADLINLYGPTETCIDATYWICERNEENSCVPIGRPISNVQTFILDDTMQPVPIGVVGELYIGGEGLAKEYLNLPELTADNFVKNPFSEKQNNYLYKTGDSVRLLKHGEIEFIGRKDQQVKLRGVRIELSDIETALLLHPNVRGAVAIIREDNPGSQLLVAYLVLKKDVILSWESLREFIKSKLPSYMIPSNYVFMDNFPKLPNGKLNKKSLPIPEVFVDKNEDIVEARTILEMEIFEIWAEILGNKHFGVYSNFFEIGGHSLSAIQAVSRIKNKFKVDIEFNHIYENPVIAELANIIEEMSKQNDSSDFEIVAERAVIEQETFPLSFGQKRLWYLDQLVQGSGVYNIPFAIHCFGKLNREALQRALTDVVQRHELLRIKFSIVEGEPRLMESYISEVVIPEYDLRQFPIKERDERAQILMQKEASSNINLFNDAAWKVKLICITDEEYYLLFIIHHIICDGWSTRILFREIASTYNSALNGGDHNFAELTKNFFDFSKWQHQMSHKKMFLEQSTYWKKQLAEAPALLELPIDFVRPAVQNFRGAYYRFVISKSLSEKIKSFARVEKITLYTLVITAFLAMLYRYTQQEDILIGSPFAGRTQFETEPIFGLFANTVVLRSKISDEISFRELLGQMKKTIIEALLHQDYPFDKLVEEMNPKRDLSYHPIFQVMFDFIDYKDEEIILPELRLVSEVMTNGSSKFDLTLEVKETKDSLEGVFEYNCDLFKESTIARMSGHLETLIGNMISNPDVPLSSLLMLTNEEEKQLTRYNIEFANYSTGDFCIHQLFEAQAAKHSKREAVKFNDRSYNYQELNEEANKIAHYLQSAGVKPDDLVGIFMDRSLEIIPVLLGILKAGGAYVPLDTEYPQDRLANMLGICEMKVIITRHSLVTLLPETSSKILFLEQEELRQQPLHNPTSAVHSKNLAYVIFTSGSTGLPKAVMVQHDTLVNVGMVWKTEFEINCSTRILNIASISFDVFAGDLIKMIISDGGSLVICPLQTRLDMQSLCKLLNNERVTLLDTTPGLVMPLMEYIYLNNLSIANLKILIIGSDIFSLEDYRVLMNRFGNQFRILNVYGITEATIDSSYFESSVEKLDPNSNGYVPIGRPLSNTYIYILDKNMNLQPVGLMGELYIGGKGISRGYYGRPDLTAERFVEDPFLKGQKIYKTGDIARLDEDGNIEFIGRIDQQIKIRGFRIEVDEIEYILNKFYCVDRAVVVAQSNANNQKELVAYLVVKNQQNTTLDEILDYLKTKIPMYMIPSKMICVDHIPMTPNGKVDRRSLMEKTNLFLQQNSSKYIAEPRDMIEHELVKIWESLLNIYPISIRDNFFDVGGHSLLVIQMLNKIYQNFGKEISISNVIQGSTIEGISVLIRQNGNQKALKKHLVTVQPIGSKPPIFFMPHIGGYFFNLMHLFRMLNSDQPIYALKNSDPFFHYESVEELAAAFVKEIIESFPQGPYMFAGHSFGGLIAYEVARQMLEKGRDVRLVALLDTFASQKADKYDSDHYLLEYASRFNVNFDSKKLLSLPYEERIQLLLQLAKESKYVTPDTGIMEIENEMKVRIMHSMASDLYVPKSSMNQVVLFRAMDEEVDSSLSWKHITTSSFRIVDVPGNHLSMVRHPHVKVLGQLFSKCIDEF